MKRLNKKAVLFAITVLFFAAFTGAAQGPKAYKERLSLPDTLHNSRVVVIEKGEAAEVVSALEARRKPSEVNGYRVRIFFDNSQTARSGAAATRERFKEAFPDTPVYMNYENPYFKITVGNCLTSEEAVTLWGRVKEIFPKAFVIYEKIDVAAFAE